jgi:cytochrome c oxidase subunit 1
VVESRTPLWDEKGELPVVTGLRVDEKETLLTTVVAATPDLREPIPQASLWPFIAACATAVFFISSIFSPWAIVFGAIPTAIALAAWFWPKKIERHPEPVIVCSGTFASPMTSPTSRRTSSARRASPGGASSAT